MSPELPTGRLGATARPEHSMVTSGTPFPGAVREAQGGAREAKGTSCILRGRWDQNHGSLLVAKGIPRNEPDHSHPGKNPALEGCWPSQGTSMVNCRPGGEGMGRSYEESGNVSRMPGGLVCDRGGSEQVGYL